MAKKRSLARQSAALVSMAESTLLADVRKLILEAQEQTAQVVNAALTLTYWNVGNRIRRDILKEKRAEYGDEIVAALGRQLQEEFGRGFGEKNLRRMVQFAAAFPDESIVAALRRQLGWTHFKSIIPIKDPLKRDFYAEMCRIETGNSIRKPTFRIIALAGHMKGSVSYGRQYGP